MNPTAAEIHQGAINLLENCAQMQPGQRLVIVAERPELGWYDDVARRVAEVAIDVGIDVSIREVGGPHNGVIDENEVAGEDWDCCIFFARIGDQIRFKPATDDRTRVMSYASTVPALGSLYGQTSQHAMLDLKKAVDEVLSTATNITIQCAQGTDLVGTVGEVDALDDVTLRRFPMGVHTPIDSRSFTGAVALAGYLTPTGSRVYDPPSLAIEQPVLAQIADGMVTSLVGETADVARIETHYQAVADQFDLHPRAVTSWHAGIHPARSYRDRVSDDADRWSNTVFTSPRFVHFHTCADTEFGEIAWMVHDPTISADGVALWEDGVLHPERAPQTSVALERWPQLVELFEPPKQPVGNVT